GRGTGPEHRDHRRRRGVQSRPGGRPAAAAGGNGAGERSFSPAQHRQCGYDRGRRSLAACPGGTKRPRPRAAGRSIHSRAAHSHRIARMNDAPITVYPFIINLGPLEVTGYGIMMMVGFLMGGWLAGRELRRLGFREEYSADMVVAAV